MSTIRVAVLTVSDTAATDPSADKSGPTIQRILAERGLQCVANTIVNDDEARIRDYVRAWAEGDTADLILTTGGTGFGVRDRTPEALTPLIDRPAPGIVHLLLSTSLAATPFAALSRPIAGTIINALVITLPGSVKAVTENLDALLQPGVLDHAIDLLRGGSGRAVHSALAGASGSGSANTSDGDGAQDSAAHQHHHHHHHHHHGDHSHTTPQPRTTLSHDPSAPVTARHRISPWPLHSLEYALNKVMTEIRPLPVEDRPVTPALRGHVIAEDVLAPHDAPRSPTTNVDGYAVRSSDPPGIYKVLTSQTLPANTPVPAGHIYRINTGAPLPPGTDAVLMVEDTRLHTANRNDEDEDEEEDKVEALAQVDPGENVRAAGSDARQGDLVLERGTIVGAHGGELGTLAFVGRSVVRVHRKPVVALLSTGNELLDIEAPLTGSGEGGGGQHGDGWGGIWDTNRPSLRAALEGLGYAVLDLGIVPDTLDAHVRALQSGLANADIVITTGGTSMGASDLLKPAIERRLGGTVHFGRVGVKPGKPTTFAVVPGQREGEERQVPVFALPGNPASALVMFHVFVVPALRKLGGWPAGRCQLPRVRVQIQHAMPLDPRVEFHRVTIRASGDGLRAYSTGGQRSSRVASLAGANGLVVLPALKEGGPRALEKGEWAEAIVIGELVARY
ncbi:molybdenum cofactor biosynthesis protein [Trametopsis cervina]|nr:molybdenum cofactor biosynthesis protein [Trametopsis cervina]